jgi:hypothetical protein
VVALLTLVNFVNYLDRMVVVTMYDDLRRIFHFSNGQLGALSSAFFTVHQSRIVTKIEASSMPASACASPPGK